MDASKEIRLRSWAADLADQKASGMTVDEWCESKGIKKRTFEYHRKMVYCRMSDYDKSRQSNSMVTASSSQSVPEIVKVELPEVKSSSGITISRDNMSICIGTSASESQIKAVLETLCHA